jgi:hypothetical protein
MAIGDFNNDGSVDVLIAVNDGPPLLLRNQSPAQNHSWSDLGGKKSILTRSERKSVIRQVISNAVTKVGGGSYLSAHDPRMVLGLETRPKVDWLEVKWPKPSARVDYTTFRRSLHHDCRRAGKWK